MAVAIFDVDHTITRKSTGRRLVQYGRHHGLFDLGDLLRLPRLYAEYRWGSLDVSGLAESIGHIRGRTHDDLARVCRDCYHALVHGDLMKDALVQLAWHRGQGDIVVIATSSLDLVINPMADDLGIAHVVASSLEFVGGVATGRLDGLPALGDEKLRRTLEMLNALGESIEEATFYSDSHLDIPLLAQVGTAVAVNPDRRLRRMAAARGWRLQRFAG